MKVRVPLMVQDPEFARFKDLKQTEGFDITREDYFLDGPVIERVAVLDFDPESDEVIKGARFVPPKKGRVMGRYRVEDESNVRSPDFIQVNTFATVLKTIYEFEKSRLLGRRLTWAFEGPQLLVVPRAGKWRNAFYERNSRSLQLFFFDDARSPQNGNTVYTSLSRDIVAHETGHAILDGIAPDLYHATAPQSLALHEAIADLTALMMAFASHNLRKAVLDSTGGSIKNSTAFSAVAEEFATAYSADEHVGWLRNLKNDKNLIEGDPNCVAGSGPHKLSEVLSGALYEVMIKIHEAEKRRWAAEAGKSEFAVSGKALAVGGGRFERLVFRALDYLPPGEVSFADYGRAVLAADEAHNPHHEQERAWIREEFVRRNIVADAAALDSETNFDYAGLADVDLEELCRSDWLAYQFATQHWEFLRIPEGFPFEVHPRRIVEKTYYLPDGTPKVRECLFRVSWTQTEPNNLGSRFPAGRRFQVGTTLAIDCDTKKVRTLLTSDNTDRPGERDDQQRDRDRFLQDLAARGILRMGEGAAGPDGRPRASAIRAEEMSGYMRVYDTARMLHIVEAEAI
ncbi:MAG: hypothetical protein JSU81_05590 [Candidatus Coatesbacteria bacterium]|nr:MAG: hypothetical protein JSU81_05590 [Candidatus Coatesbacteria bacterium]